MKGKRLKAELGKGGKGGETGEEIGLGGKYPINQFNSGRRIELIYRGYFKTWEQKRINVKRAPGKPGKGF
jgi:hypothetical protein